MNQTILFNDDHFFNAKIAAWCFTGLLSGEIINICIFSKYVSNETLTEKVKFDWEMLIVDWLEENEPICGVIEITI